MNNLENYERNKELFVSGQNAVFETMKSSGPGGQNVNKRSTAVRLRISIENISVSEEQKDIILQHMASRHITKDNEIIIENSEGKSQKENKKRTIEIANQEIQKALKEGLNKKNQELHKKRVQKRQAKSGGAKADKKETQKQKYRKETTDDLIQQAINEDPDLKDRLSND